MFPLFSCSLCFHVPFVFMFPLFSCSLCFHVPFVFMFPLFSCSLCSSYIKEFLDIFIFKNLKYSFLYNNLEIKSYYIEKVILKFCCQVFMLIEFSCWSSFHVGRVFMLVEFSCWSSFHVRRVFMFTLFSYIKEFLDVFIFKNLKYSFLYNNLEIKSYYIEKSILNFCFHVHHILKKFKMINIKKMIILQ